MGLAFATSAGAGAGGTGRCGGAGIAPAACPPEPRAVGADGAGGNGTASRCGGGPPGGGGGGAGDNEAAAAALALVLPQRRPSVPDWFPEQPNAPSCDAVALAGFIVSRTSLMVFAVTVHPEPELAAADDACAGAFTGVDAFAFLLGFGTGMTIWLYDPRVASTR